MRTLQLPLYHFLALDGDESGSFLSTDRIYVPRLRMFVPYLSVPVSSSTNGMDLLFVNKDGRVPYAVQLPRPVDKYGDWREQVVIRRRSKMRWLLMLLPECSIRDQYAAAERYEIRGYTSLRAIESGAVIRELRWLCERVGTYG